MDISAAAHNVSMYYENPAFVYSEEVVRFVSPSVLVFFTMIHLATETISGRFLKLEMLWTFRSVAILFLILGNLSFILVFAAGTILAHPFNSLWGRITCVTSFVGLSSYAASIFAIHFSIKELNFKLGLKLLENRDAKAPSISIGIIMYIVPMFVLQVVLLLVLLYVGVIRSGVEVVKFQMGILVIPGLSTIYAVTTWGKKLEISFEDMISELDGMHDTSAPRVAKNKELLMSVVHKTKTFNKNFLQQSFIWIPLSLIMALTPVLDYEYALVIFVRWITPVSWLQFNAVVYYFLQYKKRLHDHHATNHSPDGSKVPHNGAHLVPSHKTVTSDKPKNDDFMSSLHTAGDMESGISS